MKVSFYIISAVVIGVVCYFNYLNIVEAYGGGPPYYDRTTNMDKWQNPVPMLIAVNLVALGAIFGLFRFFKMLIRKRSNKNI